MNGKYTDSITEGRTSVVGQIELAAGLLRDQFIEPSRVEMTRVTHDLLKQQLGLIEGMHEGDVQLIYWSYGELYVIIDDNLDDYVIWVR